MHRRKEIHAAQQQNLSQNVYSTQTAEATSHNVSDTIMSPMHHIYYPQCSRRKLTLRL